MLILFYVSSNCRANCKVDLFDTQILCRLRRKDFCFFVMICGDNVWFVDFASSVLVNGGISVLFFNLGNLPKNCFKRVLLYI